MNNNHNHYPVGVVFGLSDEVPFELIVLHIKSIGGVLEDGREPNVGELH